MFLEGANIFPSVWFCVVVLHSLYLNAVLHFQALSVFFILFWISVYIEQLYWTIFKKMKKPLSNCILVLKVYCTCNNAYTGKIFDCII